MNRTIFVGMHNKPNKQPLDSSTKTGKIIDVIIKELPGECIKTNLFNDDYKPVDQREIWAGNLYWNEQYKPTENDVIVLLGKWVQKNFLLTNAKIIMVKHPASIYSDKSFYIDSIVKQILEWK